MGFDLSSLFAGGIEGIFKGARDIIGAFKVDPTIAAGHAAKLAELENTLITAQLAAEVQLAQAQSKINEIEAASTDKYSSRWRPTVGWVCCAGLVYSVVGFPLLTWASLNLGWKSPPVLDTGVLTSMLAGLLGIAGLRSFDKSKGTA